MGCRMKEYCYDKKTFTIKVTAISVFCILISLYVIWQMLVTKQMNMLLILIITGYTIWNSFISMSNPSKVVLSKDGVTFSAYGREDHYPMADIKSFRVKDFPGSRKMFIRVNGGGILKGRYWVAAYYFNDTDELYNAILELENKIHPGTLKSRARFAHKK